MKNDQWKSKDPKGAPTPKGSNAKALEAIASQPDYTTGDAPGKQKPKSAADSNGGGSKNPLKAVRAKCLDCVCYQPSLVAECHISTCALHPFRMGRNPFRKSGTMTEDRRAELLRRLPASQRLASPEIQGENGKEGTL